MDQPESIIIYFDVIAGAVAEHQKEERERMEFDNQQKSLERVWNVGR